MYCFAYGKNGPVGAFRYLLRGLGHKAAPNFIFLLVSLTAIAAKAQTITLELKKAPLETAFKQIQTQSGFQFVYASEIIVEAHPVTLHLKSATLSATLSELFTGQPLSYQVQDHFILVKRKEVEKPIPHDLSGIVMDEKGTPIIGATITVKGKNKITVTNDRGEFILSGLEDGYHLQITSVGYLPQELAVEGETHVVIRLKTSVSPLDETVIVAYGLTTRRLSTGSVSKVSGKDISLQPVSNPLQALYGRVPGLVITESTGLPGAALKVQIRGRNSIAQGTDPLIIIDGIPFAPNNGSLNNATSAFSGNHGGVSPLESLDPEDISSIEVLKDADATAIYGSRGANGVILITTKKGVTGKTSVNVRFYKGWSTITRFPEMLSTPQYLGMRHEAFANDVVTPTSATAPDLLRWDTTRYTDFRKLLLGGKAHVSDGQMSVEGGPARLHFRFSGGVHRETTVFPGSQPDERGSLQFNVGNAAISRLNFQFTTYYGSEVNRVPATDLTYFVTSPPNLPQLYDSTGHLNWQGGGSNFTNPLSYTQQHYTAHSDNLLSNLQLSYHMTEGLALRINTGYNLLLFSETTTVPRTSQNPAYSPMGRAQFGSNQYKGWIIEPQVEYEKTIHNSRVDLLVGSTWQQTFHQAALTYATGYTNDQLLQYPTAAGSLNVSGDYDLYHYTAVFARLNYNYKNTYILNLSGRRDGSSRFGPRRQFANFGAVGAGWVFTNLKSVKDHLGILNFGKLRASYGITGNDQIGNYQYLDSWTATVYPYLGTPGLVPARLYNPDYGWEVNRKGELAMDINFFHDQLQLSVDYYNNRTSNQLIAYKLPTQTGFMSILRNFPAEVENRGWEGQLSWLVAQHKKWNLTTSINLSVPHNRLVSFPSLGGSSYSYLVEGRPLNLYGGYPLLGVDPQTGLYIYADHSGKPTSNPSYQTDYRNYLGSLDPGFYGGWSTTLSYLGFTLDMLWEVRKQQGPNYRYSLRLNGVVPGTMHNQPSIVSDHWQSPGDQGVYFEKYTTSFSSPAYLAGNILFAYSSDGRYTDASYVRLKNLSLSYTLQAKLLHRLSIQRLQLFARAQNLLTISSYKGGDPESLSLFTLPPLKTWVVGLSVNF